MYHIYRYRVSDEQLYWDRYRVNLTREQADAELEKAKQMKNSICTYVRVAASKEAAFIAECRKINARISAPKLARETRKERRWKELDEMYKKGYRVPDVLAYVNA